MLRTLLPPACITMLLVGLMAFAPAAPAYAAGEGAAAVPMLRQGHLPVVEAFINGVGPLRIGVDSAASGRLMMTDALVERLGLAQTGEVMATDGTGRNAAARPTYTVPEVRVGPLTFLDVESIAGLRSNPALGEPIDGVAGLRLFEGFLTTFDYGKQEFRFERGALPEPDGRTVLACEAGAPVPTLTITVAGVDVRAHLDTRNTGAIAVPESVASEMTLKDKPVTVGRGRTQFNEFEIKAAHAAGTLRVGGYEFVDPLVTFAEPFRTGNVGSRVLEQFTVTFDMENDRVRLLHESGEPLRVPEPERRTASMPAPGPGLGAPAGSGARPNDGLDAMVGEWKIDARLYTSGPDAPPLEMTGRATWARDHGGKVVHERFTLDSPQGPLSGEAFLGFNAMTGRHEFVQVDAFNPTVFILVAGKRDAATGAIEMEQFTAPPGAPGAAPAGGPVMPLLRWVYRFEADGSFVKTMLSERAPGEWAVRSEYRYSKK